MKKIKLLSCLLISSFFGKAQLNVADFESFTLSPNSYYTSTLSLPFSTNNALFEYQWDASFSYWAGGFSYTNRHDSATAGFTNLYGNIAYTGYNNSSNFVVGQDNGVIKMAASQNTVNGFYITNTTFAYKSMLHGDAFARKFGDTTGAGTGTTIAQGSYPDYFKITIKGYDNGIMKQDSVEFYLADYRFTNNTLDYIINTWQWINTTALGEVDSIRFFMYSSDMGSFGINTPLFFAIDNFTTQGIILGLDENNSTSNVQFYPNPFQNKLYLQMDEVGNEGLMKLYDQLGQKVFEQKCAGNQLEFDLSHLSPGIYLLNFERDSKHYSKKLIKN